MAAKNGTWLVVLIVLIGVVLVALSLTHNKAKEPVAEPVAAAVPSTASAPVTPIKMDHSAVDMEKIAATKPASAVIEQPQAVAMKEAFAIQVYSFKDKNRADAALKSIKAKGYPGYIMMSDLGSRGVFYRVRVGSFANEEQAKKSLEAVTRDFKSGIIVAE